MPEVSMALQRASCQPSLTLRQFYESLAKYPRGVPMSQEMLRFLPLLEDLCVNLPVWAVTSHEAMNLHANDDYASASLVCINPAFFAFTGHTSGSFEISYLMPADEAPWRDARVHGYAETALGAMTLVRTAIVRSRGWPGADELLPRKP